MLFRLLFYIGIHLMVSGLYYLLMYFQFGVPGNSFLLHCWLSSIFHILIFIPAVVFRQQKPVVVMTQFLLSIYWLSLLVLMLLNVFSFYNWGGPIMFDFVEHLPRQIVSLAQVKQIPLVMVVLVLLIFWIGIYWLITLLKLPQAMVSVLKPEYLKKAAIYSVLYLFVFFVSLRFSFRTDNPKDWIYEPFFAAISENSNEFISISSKASVLNDHQERKKYAAIFKPEVKVQNIILIVVDALRADRMGMYGYERETTPFLSSKQGDANFQVVNKFTSTCSESVCGIYSILSSRYYQLFGFGLFDLTEVLSDLGFDITFILSSNHRFKSLKKLYGKHVNLYIDGVDFPAGITFNDDEGVIDQISALPQNQGKSNFIYLHLMSAHILGTLKPEFNKYLPQTKHTPALIGAMNKAELESYKSMLSNGYDNGVLQTDNYIKRALDLLSDKGYLDQSVILITSDHGDGLGEHGHFSHTYNLYQEDINIPLVWMSQLCKLKNLRYGTQIDLAPTVLDCLNQPIPSTWQGRSLMKEYEPGRLTFHQTVRHKKTVMVIQENTDNFYKLMAQLEDGKYSNFRMYDIYEDPSESENIINQVNPQLVEFLKRELMLNFNIE